MKMARQQLLWAKLMCEKGREKHLEETRVCEDMEEMSLPFGIHTKVYK